MQGYGEARRLSLPKDDSELNIALSLMRSPRYDKTTVVGFSFNGPIHESQSVGTVSGHENDRVEDS